MIMRSEAQIIDNCREEVFKKISEIQQVNHDVHRQEEAKGDKADKSFMDFLKGQNEGLRLALNAINELNG